MTFILLSAYFYFWAVVGVLIWVVSLFLPLKHSKGDSSAGYAIGAVVLLTVLSLPGLYLQLEGLKVLGLPAWLGWVAYGSSLISAVAYAAKPGTVSGQTQSLAVLSLAVSFIGLQSLAP